MAARRIVPGTTYLVTRRCREGQFFLAPSAKVRRIVLYCLFFVARLCKVDIHAFCFMSNHFHLVLTDREGCLPAFMKRFNEYVSKCLNCLYRRRGSLWDPDEKYNAVELRYERDIIDKIVYLHANPVEAGLVPRPSQWIGERSLPADVGGKTWRAKRPGQYFSGKAQPFPEMVEYQLPVPPALERLGYDVTKYREVVLEALRKRVEQIHRNFEDQGRKFVGRRKLRYFWKDRPKNPDLERGEIIPQFACKDLELRQKWIEELKAFRAAYKDARRRYRDGETDVEFPAGTYWLRVHVGVRCKAPPPIAA